MPGKAEGEEPVEGEETGLEPEEDPAIFGAWLIGSDENALLLLLLLLTKPPPDEWLAEAGLEGNAGEDAGKCMGGKGSCKGGLFL